MKSIKSIVFTLLLAVCYTFTAAENKPYGLLTDLVEHTGCTWNNGYASNVPVWNMEEATESLQYVKIGSAYPTFSWIVPGNAHATYQTFCRIIVADNMDDATMGKGNIWDSGMVESNKSTSVLFGGNALQPEKNYFWRVKTITNTGGESEWSDIKAFRTAEQMKEYTAAFYPQIKEMEHPVAINKVSHNTTLVDFGKDAFGQLVVNLTSGTGRDTVIIHLGESLSDGKINRKPGGTIRYHRYVLGLMKGTHTYRIKIKKDRLNTRPVAVPMPDYIGEVLPFRYCEIEGYEKTPVLSDFVRESVYYPFDESASFFQCSNDTLNQIWNLCKYSIKATSFAGIYVDGDRERIPYEADALINQLCHYGVDREYSMARRSHEYLLEYPTWPTEWILQAVLIAWNDYMYTGDSRSLRANYDILKARTLLSLREKNGLISTTTGLITPEVLSSVRFNGQIRDIVDWPHTGILGLNKQEGGEADGFVFTDYNVVTNAYHYEALKLMSGIAQVINLPAEATWFEKEAAQFLSRFNKTFLNRQAGYYVDGDTTLHASLHANMFPVAFGMVPSGRIKNVLEFIRSRQMACSVYGSQFLMDALYEAADAEYALSMLTKTDDRSWYNMIRVGSTISLEAWDNKYKPNQDWNHAWGAVPANIIPRKLMGVEPLQPGFDKVRIKPQLATLAWGKATIPTIKGEIQMEVENQNNKYCMQVTIPANMEADVYLPLPAKKYNIQTNGQVQKAIPVKGTPFLSLGTLPSGRYTIEMTYP
ncbi:MAG: family 78 glycoside hydrolase catalytic domain [Tannerellaceae bacterium]|nr:family 78 glycoside hydrolase catalytic domain [Tannerellaceae bacterium]